MEIVSKDHDHLVFYAARLAQVNIYLLIVKDPSPEDPALSCPLMELRLHNELRVLKVS